MFRTLVSAWLSGEPREFFGFIRKHLANKVPSASALAGVASGACVSSAFATSPVRDAMHFLGITGRGADVASPLSYRLVSIFLPLFAAATTVYLVQKRLRARRRKLVARYAGISDGLEAGKREELAARVDLLERARQAGLLSESECEVKLQEVYAACSKSRMPAGVEEFIVKKLTS